jgi:hypothetical protein
MKNYGLRPLVLKRVLLGAALLFVAVLYTHCIYAAAPESNAVGTYVWELGKCKIILNKGGTGKHITPEATYDLRWTLKGDKLYFVHTDGLKDKYYYRGDSLRSTESDITYKKQTTTKGELIAENKHDAKAALACTKNCPDFSDLYAGDADFQKSFLAALKAAKISKPTWFPKGGTEAPVEPLVIEGKTYLKGFIFEPHYSAHAIHFLYLESQKRTVGKYKDGNGNTIWFGNPDKLERNKLIDE